MIRLHLDRLFHMKVQAQIHSNRLEDSLRSKGGGQIVTTFNPKCKFDSNLDTVVRNQILMCTPEKNVNTDCKCVRSNAIQLQSSH